MKINKLSNSINLPNNYACYNDTTVHTDGKKNKET